MMRSMLHVFLRFMLSFALLGECIGHADPVVFDFEEQSFDGGLTDVTLTDDASGLAITITRPGDMFDFRSTDNMAGFGSSSLSPFFSSGAFRNTAFVVNFSSPVSSVTLSAGDFTIINSDLDTLKIEAFSGPDATGTLLKSVNTDCCFEGNNGTDFGSTTVTVVAAGIKSIRFIGGSAGKPNSLYYDNLTVEQGVSDSDGDGISDDQDQCANSDLYPTVVVGGHDSGSKNTLFNNGCTVTDYVMACANDAVDHGAFVSCVDHLMTSLRKQNVVTVREGSAVQHCAARANLP